MNRAFSFGGGRQSTAALVLAARGELEVDCFVFANVGDDSENPDTLAYVEEHAKPFAQRHGLDLVEVQRAEWSRMRLHKPELFERSVQLEQRMNAVRDRLGKDHLYFTDRLRPLDVSIPQGVEQLDLFEGEDASCSSGYCWT